MERRLLIQMTAPTVVVGLLLFAVCLVSSWSVNHLQSRLSFTLASNGASMEAAREMVQKLQAQQRDLLHAQQLSALGQLAASVAHDIRNPLMSIKMLVEAARSFLIGAFFV